MQHLLVSSPSVRFIAHRFLSCVSGFLMLSNVLCVSYRARCSSVTIYGCRKCNVTLGPVTRGLFIEHCEKVQVSVCCRGLYARYCGFIVVQFLMAPYFPVPIFRASHSHPQPLTFNLTTRSCAYIVLHVHVGFGTDPPFVHCSFVCVAVTIRIRSSILAPTFDPCCPPAIGVSYLDP